MSDRMLANSALAFSPAVVTSPSPARPVAARTKLQLEGPILLTLLRLSTPNILNLLAIAGMPTRSAWSRARAPHWSLHIGSILARSDSLSQSSAVFARTPD